MANVMKREKQELIIKCLVDGASIRATERITGAHRDSIMRLGRRVAVGCERLHDEHMQALTCKRIQCDEIWGYVGKKQGHLLPTDSPENKGDFWTWVNIRRLTRLTNAFSKTVEGLKAAVSLHFAYYNFVRPHRSLGEAPAVAAGVLAKPMTLGDLLDAQVW